MLKKAIRTDLKVVYVTGQTDLTLNRTGETYGPDRAQAVRLAPIGDTPASGFRMTSKHPAENRRDAGVRIPGSVLKASRGLIPNSVSL